MQVLGYSELRLHTNVARSVDALLSNETPCTQLRRFVGDRALVRFEGPSTDPGLVGGRAASARGGAEQVGGAASGQWLDDLVDLSQGAQRALGGKRTRRRRAGGRCGIGAVDG